MSLRENPVDVGVVAVDLRDSFRAKISNLIAEVAIRPQSSGRGDQIFVVEGHPER